MNGEIFSDKIFSNRQNTFAALSDETTIENPRHLRKAEQRLKWDQRQLSRKQKGSRNRDRAKRKVAKAHRKVTSATQGLSSYTIVSHRSRS
ncbi:transposase [Brevibacillus massiliensis]|uniref:transposase n=1 Tax=Brevibacillus massiliensis TaxID=1118054 RepID=UPI0002FCA81A